MNQDQPQDPQDPQDPQRWADRAEGPAIADRVGADIRKMGEPVLPDDHALARLHQLVVTPPARRRWPLGALAIACGVALIFVAGAVSAQLGRFPFLPRERTPAIDQLSVPKGSTVRLRGKRQRTMALVGPAEITVGDGDGKTDSIALGEGLLAIEAGERPLAVSVAGASVTVPAGSSGTVSARGTEPLQATAISGTVTVTSSDGTTVLGEGQTWRRGVTAAAAPEQRDSAVRALNAEPRGEPPAPPSPAPVPAPAPSLKPQAPSHRPAATIPSRAPAASAETSAPAPTTLALAAPPAPVHTPPAFPAPALPLPRAVPPPPLAPPSATRPPPDGELALIAAAVRKLRTDDDPRGALAVLDQHRARFPSGALTREATLARVETLLALDRRDEALRVLDDAVIGDLPRARAVRATRGELRAELGHCDDAVKDFELLLSSNQRDGYAERALYGRAACRARAGDTARARADLDHYRNLYPQGRFAADVQRLFDGR